jgi:CRP-like cAMP-binding protein
VNPLWQNIFRTRTNEQSLAYFLGTVPAFSKLEKRDLDFLENIVHIRNYQADEMVFSQGDIGSGMYIIRSGQVQVYSHDDQDRKTDHALLEPGDFFGEVALTASRPRCASAKATAPTVLIGLFRSDIEEAMRRHPASTAKIMFGLNRVISDRLLQCSLQLQELKRKWINVRESKNDE